MRRNPARPERPYRVGMARHAQRVLEPDEVYPDMGRGGAQRIPQQFPFTWTPVNGLDDSTQFSPTGGIGGGLGVGFDDIVKSVTDIARGGGDAVQDRAKDEVEDFLNKDPIGRAILDKVKDKAAEGVTGVVKKQAPNLMLLAVAGGAVGGVVSEKLGKTGTVLALIVAGWAGYQLLNAKVE